ncbi:MAG: tRNA preQ1(34) S-adenosylmethionine ribosyltransferase-isomerase QueA [Candidatus Omnitrophica bacterium]|nr:tRNA preQ1(34) S-adenosylmethionine ribosyltransferase-isomerase QueA [Candidatus Omnitrophota bacterium]
MKLSDFDYVLPKELIAQQPLKQRDMARLLVIERAKNRIKHCIFKDISDYLAKDDLLVLNDTKVLPCRLEGRRKTGGKVEILLLRHNSRLKFDALIKPLCRLKLGEKISLKKGKFFVKITGRNEVSFDNQFKSINSIYQLGQIPLPPYIKREPNNLDKNYYQTVYAKKEGAVAAPTAGLHFTKRLLDKIKSKGINISYITLHISYSTFKPIKTEDITQHRMDKEYFSINEKTLRLIKKTHKKNGRIFCVGTSTCRALETFATRRKKGGWTDLFIYPGYKFNLVDGLVTNFHLPRSSLFLLVCAFAGEKLIKRAYQEAIERRYRFYSYGDAMLII